MSEREVPWEEIRRKYENERQSARSLAQEYGIPCRLLYRVAAEEAWRGHRKRSEPDMKEELNRLTQQLVREAQAAAKEMKRGELDLKELKDLAGLVQTLAGLEKTLGGQEQKRPETVEVVMGQEAEELSR